MVHHHVNLIKYSSLIFMVVQTSALVLALRYSRLPSTNTASYISSTAVAVAEVTKVITCIIVVIVIHGVKLGLSKIYKEVFLNYYDTLMMVVPAGLYTFQNNLLYIALSNLDAATYQITYQLKILTTAMFMITMMGKKISASQWVALLLLVIGVALVQMPTSSSEKVASANGKATNMLIGLFAVLTACFCSGFAGVYFERILKGSDTSIWMRNIQLGLFGVVLGFSGVFFYDGARVRDEGLLVGYSNLVWLIIGMQTVGGLCIALVMRYADNILKGFATSLSILLSCAASYFLLHDFIPSISFFFGALLVLAATFIYGINPKLSIFKIKFFSEPNIILT